LAGSGHPAAHLLQPPIGRDRDEDRHAGFRDQASQAHSRVRRAIIFARVLLGYLDTHPAVGRAELIIPMPALSKTASGSRAGRRGRTRAWSSPTRMARRCAATTRHGGSLCSPSRTGLFAVATPTGGASPGLPAGIAQRGGSQDRDRQRAAAAHSSPRPAPRRRNPWADWRAWTERSERDARA
jgi:hypothetical protein